ncbi:MAG: PKD domain-containing protein [Bacteroidia bacterium]
MKLRIHPTPLFVTIFLLIFSSILRLNAQTAKFTLSLNKGCAPLSGVVVTDLSTGGNNYDWDFGNGNKSTTAGNQLASYPNPGKYVVKLKLNGSSTYYDTVNVFANPIANYIITSPMPACVGQAISFTSTSTPGSGSIIKWVWDFNDGNALTTTVGNTTHAYNAPKTTAVSLIVTDNNGCSGNTSSTPGTKPVVTILESPKAIFTASPLSSCTAPLTVTLTNTSVAAATATYKWTFGDGSTSAVKIPPAHLYNTLGTYPITLIVTQGACKDSSTKSVIIKSIVADFKTDKSTICIGTSVSFTDASAPLSTSRLWDFGDGTTKSPIANPTHLYAAIGTYTVKLDATVTTTSGTCSNAITKTVTVVPLPVVSFTANAQQSCMLPFNVTFNNTSVGTDTYLWDFGDGSTSSTSNAHTYTKIGKYTVTLTVTSASGCKSSIIKNDFITITLPQAKFIAKPREGCFPLKVLFTSESISVIEPIVSYVWTFGNGTTKTTSKDTVTAFYNAEGVFDVKLVVTTASGCKDSVTYFKYIKAGHKPKANFSVVNPVVCYGVPTIFNDLSIDGDSAYWSFGEGTLSTLNMKSPVTHLYNLLPAPMPLPNIFPVQLITYNKGCPDTLTKPQLITINPPKPIFTIKPVDCTKPYLRTFDDLSIGADSLRWDFGDSTTIVRDSLHPKHTYTTTGLKTIKLIAINKTTGCSFFITDKVNITDVKANYSSALIGCYPFLVKFVDSSMFATQSSWNFGDGTPNENTTTPKPHTYTLPGLYTAQLIVTDANNCKDTVSKKINVQGPRPDFKSDTTKGCTPLLVKFADLTKSDSTLVKWTWNFGDLTTPQTVTTSTINHIYTIPGSYKVTLTSLDKNGCTSTIEKANYIVPTFPFPKFTGDTLACKGKVIIFNASTTIVAGANPKFEWTFGDGSSAIGKTTTHIYSQDSVYVITLKVTDENGCDSTITRTIRIQNPAVAFTKTIITEGCGYTNMQFNDNSTGSSITKWDWDFGDGATATNIQNPTHNYTTPGEFNVKLTVTNSAGCSNTLMLDRFVVVPGPVGTFSFTPKTGCKPFVVTFTAKSDNSTKYTWDFGDGVVISDTGKTIKHTYTQDITATPILVLSSKLANGSLCEIPSPPAGNVTVSSIISVDIDSTIIILGEGETAVLTSLIKGTSANTIYSWTPPNALSCADCPTPTVTGEGSGNSYVYYLTISDMGGCTTYDSVRIEFPKCVNDKFFIPNVFTPNGDGVNDLFDITGLCINNNYKLTIFNNWGKEMFSTTDRRKSWDGKQMKNGLEASSGVYYYILLMDGVAHKGFIHLIR